MDFYAVMGVIAGVIQIISIVPYVRSMVHGTTPPNAVSFSVWTLLGIIEAAAQISAGVTWPAVITVTMTVGMAGILVLALTGYGYRAYGLLDGACLLFALLAIGVWYATSEPVLALTLSIAGNVFATIPTIAKTYHAPRSENSTGWGLVVVASIFSLLAAETHDAANLLMPGYLLAESVLLFVLAIRRDP